MQQMGFIELHKIRYEHINCWCILVFNSRFIDCSEETNRRI
jgi:hypothetical protein